MMPPSNVESQPGSWRKIQERKRATGQAADEEVSTVSHLRSIFKPLGSQERGLPSTQEDYRTAFYETYRHEAEEYDREFIKKYDEDFNTTLIFVRFPMLLTCECADSVYRLVCSPQ
jgi:hypothetical protein